MDYRPDRLEHAQSELSKVGLFDMATRFSGIIDSTKNGAIGCTRSHIECLKFARDNKWNHVLICELRIHWRSRSGGLKPIDRRG